MTKGFITKYKYMLYDNIDLNMIYTDFNVILKIISFKKYINGNLNDSIIKTIKLTNYNCEPIIHIINEFEDGLYFINIKDTTEDFYLYFISNNNTNKKFTVLLNTNTHHAYNTFLGMCYYRNYYNSSVWDTTSTKIMPLNLPLQSCVDKELNMGISEQIKKILFTDIYNCYEFLMDKNNIKNSHLLLGEIQLYIYLYKENIDFNIVSDLDLEDSSNIDNINNLILNTHPEYWSKIQIINIYNNIINVHNKSLIILGGNVCYREVLIKNNNMIYISGKFDKHIKEINKSVPEILGLFYTPEYGNQFDNFYICDKTHKLFDNVESFGNMSCGYEIDKLIINSDIYEKREILANSKLNGNIILCYKFEKPKMLNVGSVSFLYDLNINKNTSSFVKNVLNFFK